MDKEAWLPILNALTYGIRQARYETRDVDAVVAYTIDAGAHPVTAAEYLDAARAALAYRGDLGALVGLEDRDDDFRGFLRAVEARLAARPAR